MKATAAGVRHLSFIAIAFLLLGTGLSEPAPDLYISSLEMPCYRPLARQARVQGTVKIDIDIAADGSISSVRTIEGHPLLRAAALANVRTWKFGTGERADLSGLKPTILFVYKLEEKIRLGEVRSSGGIRFLR